MDKIASFTINHLVLEPGVYVSRKDQVGSEIITTFDLRMTAPNREPVMNTAEVHTIEHLGATFLRNDPEYKDQTIYFGPMGCRTGFYLVRQAITPHVILCLLLPECMSLSVIIKMLFQAQVPVTAEIIWI